MSLSCFVLVAKRVAKYASKFRFFLIFRNASQRLSVGTLKSFTCIQETFIDLRLGRLGPARRDRNMLVKHNLLDSFGVSGLVLVGFVGGLTKGVL